MIIRGCFLLFCCCKLEDNFENKNKKILEVLVGTIMML